MSDSETSTSSNSTTPSTTPPPPTTTTNPKKRKNPNSPSNPKKSKSRQPNISSIIDDAAVHSGSDDNDSEDEEDDDPANNDYENDGFVVDDESEESEEEASPGRRKRSKAKRRPKTNRRLGRKRDTDVLDDDDLLLINEAKGIAPSRGHQGGAEEDEEDDRRRTDDDRKRAKAKRGGPKKKPGMGGETDYFDEDNIGDFIDYDDDDERDGRGDREDQGGGTGISEAQLSEANDIFGTDFMEAMKGSEDEDDEDARERKYRERGVGVDLGMSGDEEEVSSSSEDESDEDLFDQDGGGDGDDDYEGVKKRKQKRKAEKLKRRQDARKARLRRTFEPVQLIENFCTDRDDEIREKDVPERYFDRYNAMDPALDGPKAGEEGYDPDSFTEEEQEEAMWIMGRVPQIASEFFSTIFDDGGDTRMDEDGNPSNDANGEEGGTDQEQRMERKQTAILQSIINVLRYLRREKLEPEFIRRYRADYVTSVAVRENLYTVIDEDMEWERANGAQNKVETLLNQIGETAQEMDVIGTAEEKAAEFRGKLKEAQERLDDSVKEEDRLKVLLADGKDDEDEDDELFGDDDDDDDAKKSKSSGEKEALRKDLKKSNTLVTVCAEQVAHFTQSLKDAEENINSHSSEKMAIELRTKMCSTKIWNVEHYKQYLRSTTDHRHAMDMYTYLSLLKEGNNAIKGTVTGDKESTTPDADKKKRRSRRSDRDYYRTCVSQGLRSICYRFVLSPYRVGIKLEESVSRADGFQDWTRTLPGETEDQVGPRSWSAPAVEGSTPTEFATELVDSGELVLLASNARGGEEDEREMKDPLRGCRYVAAMEIAFEPRVRKHLREIYRARAVITTRPTPKGIEDIDAFHEYFGLHLLKDKEVKDHFPMDEREAELQKVGQGYTLEEQRELDETLKRRTKDSCMQYMSLLKAEDTGHIKTTVHLPFKEDDIMSAPKWYKTGDAYFTSRDNQDIKPLMDELEKVYLPLDPDTDEWNEERKKILRLAVLTFLLPKFEAEARRDMRESATKVAVDAAVQNLSTMAMEGPYRPSHLLGESRFLLPTGDLPIVGVCVSDGREPSFLASLTEWGEMGDHIGIPSGTMIDGGKMREKVIRFLMQTRPSAIVVGTSAGLRSRLIMRKLGDLVNHALERWNNRKMQGQDEDDDEFIAREAEFERMYPRGSHDEELIWNCNVEMVDDNVAQLFGRSVRGKKEFPDSAVNLKCAIATARYAKDPLAEVTYAWSAASDTGVFGTEMFYLNIHPLQPVIPKTLLLRGYERALCRAVGEVGVDVNLACKYDHMHGLLSFVPGFGPRKAANLKQGLDRSGGVFVRRKQIIQKKLVGPVVYNNAVAFLRIRQTDVLKDADLFPLDDTRLHPDEYFRAKKIALNALDKVEKEDGDKPKKKFEVDAIRDIMYNSKMEVKRLYNATKAEWEHVHHSALDVGKWNPKDVKSHQWRDKVDDLDLVVFAKMIEEGRKGKHLTHLNMIKEEFRLPFEDPRNPLEPLDKEKLFSLLTGESDQTICPGREITGKVMKNSDYGAHVKLENDLPGFIPLRNLADGHVESADDVVQAGSVVTAIVTEVKKDHLSVDLSLKQEDRKKPASSWDRPTSLLPLDQTFDKAAAVIIEEEKAKKIADLFPTLPPLDRGDDNNDVSGDRTFRVTNRACSHPAFRNARHAEVEKELKEGGESMIGEALIRPSSKEADNLVLHWVVRLDVVKVIIVFEEDKESDIGIGNVLKIKNDVYGDIDELLARYVSPLNERVEEVIHHRKFLNMEKDDIDRRLRDAKKAHPSGVFYHLCWCDRYPGCISLRFIINTNRSHLISISLEGFVWAKKVYPEMDLLLNQFKKNPSGQPAGRVGQPAGRVGQPAGRVALPPKPRTSRWDAKTNPPPPPQHPPPHPPSASNGGWGVPAPVTANSGWNTQRPPIPPSLPPPPSRPPMLPPAPGNQGWPQPPPSPALPPQPQHNYVPPPRAPMS